MTLEELTTPMTVEEARAALYEAAIDRGLDVTAWKPGSPTRTIIAALAVVVSALSTLISLVAKSGFLALSSGNWLTLVARYVYGVERDAGSFATGDVTLNNTGGGSYSGGPGDLIVLNTSSGKSFRNTESFTIAPLETGVTVEVEALEIGSDSTSAAATIDDFVTALSGVTVTNADTLVGTDEEEDEALRTRCSAKTGTLSPNGPPDAYAYVARSAEREDGSSISVNRTKTVADGNGTVTLYVATAEGAVTGTAGDLDTDLGIIDDEIQRNVVPQAVTAVVVSATPITIDVEYEYWINDAVALDEAEVETAVGVRLAEFMASRPIGGDVIDDADGMVYGSAIAAVIGSAITGVADDEVIRVEVTVGGDTLIEPDEVPVLGSATGTIHLIPTGVI